jgi:hypothetical protein
MGRILIILLLSAVNIEWVAGDITGWVTCDNSYKLYVDGNLIVKDYPWSYLSWHVAEQAVFPDDSKVIAIYGEDAGSAGGMIASFDNGVVTDNTWKCKKITGTPPTGWNEADFDDSSWPYATQHNYNGVGKGGLLINGISTLARWMWSSDLMNDNKVYCRKSLVVECNGEEPYGWTQAGPVNIDCYADGSECFPFWSVCGDESYHQIVVQANLDTTNCAGDQVCCEVTSPNSVAMSQFCAVDDFTRTATVPVGNTEQVHVPVLVKCWVPGNEESTCTFQVTFRDDST